MRVWVAAVIVLFGCRDHRLPLSNSVNMGVPGDAGQIEGGLYAIEDGAWRWSSSYFALRLGVPPHSSEGLLLVVDVYVPDVIIARHQDANLSCWINGLTLAPQTWTGSGAYSLMRAVPSLHNPVAVVECLVAKTIPPGPKDARELGLIVKTVKLLRS